MAEKRRIYVQVPAYRDAELAPTIEDMIGTAADPTRLTIAIAWQHDVSEASVGAQLEQHAPVRLHRIPAHRSRGCNWARNLLQRGWKGEEYTLLVDSHHRFVKGWDELAISLLEGRRQGNVRRPVLTGYLPPYEPGGDPARRPHNIYDLVVEERREGLAYRLHGHPCPGWENLDSPTPVGTASLHFLFADGTFNRVVRCDPTVYFFADEITIALRAFTHGYDLFRPHIMLGWHLYDRATRVTHWTDHTSESLVAEERSLARIRELYESRLFGRYGLGTDRPVSQYESSFGIQLIRQPEAPRTGDEQWNRHLSTAIFSPRSSKRDSSHPR